MNNYNFWNGWNSFSARIPDFILALLVLLIGWLIAKSIEKGAFKALQKTNLDNRLFPNRKDRKYSSEKIISKIIYVIVLVFVFILFFNILSLNSIATPLITMLSSITAAIPSVLKAALILLLAWALATGLSYLIKKSGKTLRVNQLLAKLNLVPENQNTDTLLNNVAKAAFYFVLLLFLPAVLSALNLDGVSGPLANMLDSILAFLPKLLAAALILLIGWFVAKLVRNIVTNFLKSIGTEKIVQKMGLGKLLEGTSLSSIIGMIIYVLILIPVVITALERLDLHGISQPAIAMLNDVMTMIPNIIIAIVLILIGVWAGKWINQIVTSLVRRLGLDSFAKGMGLGNTTASTATLSQIVGFIAQIVVVLLFVIEALNIVQLDFFVTIATGVIAYLPHILAALIILAVGLYVGNLAKKLLSGLFEGQSFRLLASVAKYAIIAISIFMALDQLGIASSIVNSAFIMILGGLALAFGLAFGLGGKDFAAKYLKKLDGKIEAASVKKQPDTSSSAHTKPAERSPEIDKNFGETFNQNNPNEFPKNDGPSNL